MRGVPIEESPQEPGTSYIPSNTSIGHKYIKVRTREGASLLQIVALITPPLLSPGIVQGLHRQ